MVLEFYRECIADLLFSHKAILQFLMADISFNIACRKLKIAQIVQLNQLFQLLHLVIYTATASMSWVMC